MTRFDLFTGVSQIWYHRLPSEEALAKLPPHRKAILRALAQIPYEDFPRLVEDVLVEVEGHVAVDVTDGPGDEKQDILTLRDGTRHLVQCKHTSNLEKKSSGDDLDLLFSACHRKTCKEGLFVTNGELTPQAKRYVTDAEYKRLDAEEPTLDYWDARRLWDRISRSPAILSKWFGGMVQAHGLRNLRFDVIVQRCPSWALAEPSLLHTTLLGLPGAKVMGGSDAEGASLQLDKLRFEVRPWFVPTTDLGVAYLARAQPTGALPAVRVSAALSGDEALVDPAGAQNAFLKALGNALPQPGATEWWHLLSTPPETLVNFMELGRPVSVAVGESAALVRMPDGTCVPEDEHLLVQSAGDSTEDDEMAWVHAESGTTVALNIEQPIHPVERYTMSQRQHQAVHSLEGADILKTKASDSHDADAIRRVLGIEGMMLLGRDGQVFWAAGSASDQARVLSAAQVRGLTVSKLSSDEKRDFLEQAEKAATVPETMITSNRATVRPVDLAKRVLWLIREAPLSSPSDPLKLLQYKLGYEAEHGYEAPAGKMSSLELDGALFDVQSLRGRRMLDLGVSAKKLSVFLRVRVSSLEATDTTYLTLMKHLDGVVADLLNASADGGDAGTTP